MVRPVQVSTTHHYLTVTSKVFKDCSHVVMGEFENDLNGNWMEYYSWSILHGDLPMDKLVLNFEFHQFPVLWFAFTDSRDKENISLVLAFKIIYISPKPCSCAHGKRNINVPYSRFAHFSH